jgi:four helix bundle protein
MNSHSTRPTSFEQWQVEIPDAIRCDPLWSYIAYPKALFLFDLAWFDCERLLKDVRGRIVAGQLMRATSSISANIEEGYSKGFGMDYARYLQIALGSTREARGWYWRGRRLLSSKVVNHRFALLGEIIALLITTIPRQRSIKRQK